MKKIFFILTLIGIFFLIVLGFNYTKASGPTSYIKKELSNRFIKTIVIDGNSVYIGTAYKLNILNVSDKTFKVVKIMPSNSLPDTYITAITYDDKKIWVGTPSGLASIDKKTYKVHIYKNFNNYITDLLVDGSQLWAATKQWGISILDTQTGVWNNYSILQGLADNHVNCLALDGQYIWAGTESGLSVYDKSIDFWKTYVQEDGLPFLKVSSLAVDGEYIWIGTMGGGLARLNKLDDTFLTYTSDSGLIDENIQTLTLDGKILWIGTFSGLNKFDKDKNKWESFSTVNGLPEDSVSTIAVNGNFLWVGTDGGGIVKMDKILPEAFLSPLSHYKAPNVYEIIGTSYSYQNISSLKVEYRSEILNEYSRQNIKLSKENKILNGTLGTINVKDLMNGTYYLRLTVADKQGNKNVAYMPFIVDTIYPQISIDELPKALKTPDIAVSGHYNEDNLVRITVSVGKDVVPAKIDRMQHTFTANIVLRSGLNKVVIRAQDVANLTTKIETQLIYDTDVPSFPMPDKFQTATADYILRGKVQDYSLKKIYCREKSSNIVFTPSKEKAYTYDFDVHVLVGEGNNKYTFDAYDYLGNKSTKVVTIQYNGGHPIVTIDKSKIKVSNPEYVLKGTYSGDVKDIIITPGDIKAVIDKKNKTFSAKINLNEDKNVLTATIHTLDGQKSFDIINVIYSSVEAKFALDKFNHYTSLDKILLTGTFSEPKLKSIILNPGKRRASVDFDKKTFQVYAFIKKKKNNFVLTMQDSDGVKTEKKFFIIKDTKAPELLLDDIPAVVNVDKVTVSGSYKDEYIDKITVNGKEAKLNRQNNTFSIVLPLTPGKNEITVVASDKAFNETLKTLAVKFVPQFAAAETETNLPVYASDSCAEAQRLKQEIARLKKQRVYVRKVSPTVSMPTTKAVFFAPFDRKLGDSFASVSRKYLGSSAYIPLVSALNDSIEYSDLMKRKSLLLPSKKMIQYLNRHSSFEPEVQIMNALSLSFNRFAKEKFNREKYYQAVLEHIADESARPIKKTASFLQIDKVGVAVVNSNNIDFSYYRNIKKKKNLEKIIIGKIRKKMLIFYEL